MSRCVIFMDGPKTDVFGKTYYSPPPATRWTSDSIICPLLRLRARLSPLLAACRTRARRLPLVVSFRGASSAHVPVSRPSRASIAAAPARSSVPLGPERETLPYARQSRRFVARSRAVGTIEPRKRARSASRRARSSSRITVARRLTPPASPLRSQTRARGGRAEASSRRQTWAGPLEASTRPRCGPPRAAGSRTRSTGRGTRCSGSRSWAWRAPPSSTTAGRWSRGRSRPPAGSPARGGARTSPREARRSKGTLLTAAKNANVSNRFLYV